MDGVGGMETESFSFPSFPAVPGQDGEGFADFSQFGVGSENIHIAGGFPFEIPPLPVSPDQENVHFAGGVPFDIPPLPFDDVESMNSLPLTISGYAMSTFPALTTASVSTGDEARSQATTVTPMDDTLSSKQNRTDSGMAGIEAGLANNAGEFCGFSEFAGVNTTLSGGDDFGGFGGFSATSVTGEGFGDLPPLTTTAGFSEIPGGAKSSASDSGADDFGEFGGFASNPVAATTSVSGEGAVSKGEDDFGEFGGLASNPVAATAIGSGEAAVSEGQDDFGEFGVFSSNPVAMAAGNNTSSGVSTVTATGGDDFGSFASNIGKDDDFGVFGGFTADFTANPVTSNVARGSSVEEQPGGDDFGEFGGFASNSAATEKGSDEFGGFSGFSGGVKEDSTGDSSFANFSAPVDPPLTQALGTTAPPTTIARATAEVSKSTLNLAPQQCGHLCIDQCKDYSIILRILPMRTNLDKLCKSIICTHLYSGLPLIRPPLGPVRVS